MLQYIVCLVYNGVPEERASLMTKVANTCGRHFYSRVCDSNHDVTKDSKCSRDVKPIEVQSSHVDEKKFGDWEANQV
ncbi:hypothetical protein TNCV_4597931 [Trichonephila clavipes]|nr:hypothetical protein TNCV_4597931 [Trichonephila clavipes]